MNFVRRKLEEVMPRGRKPAPGKIYYLGRLRFRPGLDPPELEDILEAITGAAPPKRAEILRAALLGGSKQARDIVGKVEDSGTTDLLNDMFVDF